ncbi:hypothetical protein [Anaerolentibacter hominis]|uniref:YfcC family protein n=1 Tax=Anaerolentibacter hominis TaxID=3079009 RepID=UPI0031B81563
MNQESLKISKKTFITSVAVLLALMLFAGILTQVVPQGHFERTVNDGRELVVPDSYKLDNDASPMNFFRVFLAPAAVLFSEDSMTIIGIIIFLVLISGAIGLLNKRGVTSYTVARTALKYRNNKYRVLRLVTLVFMIFGAVIGAFEECTTLVPFTIALALAMGWDELTGLGMSLLAAGFGFATAVCNPFTLGVAQGIAGLPLYSGILYRILGFLIVYGILTAFLVGHAKKTEDTARTANMDFAPHQSHSMDTAMKIFLGSLVCMLLIVLLGLAVPAVSDYSLLLMVLPLTAGAFLASKKAGGAGSLVKDYFSGIVGMLPAILMILMASSIKLIISEGQILDTILYYASEIAASAGSGLCVIIMYLFVLILNFFIASGSAKAFLLLPILTPLADLVGVTRQTAVLSFCFGDGFSNVFFPTNPVLLICLGLAGISYGKWAKFTWKLQAVILLVTSLLLLGAHFVGLGPF